MFRLILFLICVKFVTSTNISDDFEIKNVVYETLKEVLINDKSAEDASDCRKHLLHALKNFNQGWPLKMLDASSKLPSGLLSGHLVDLGAFDQCVSIEQKFNNDIIKGAYCKVAIPLANIQNIFKGKLSQTRGIVNLVKSPSLFLVTCVPNSCTADKINSFLQKALYGTISKTLNLTVTNCQTNDSEPFRIIDWIATVFFAIILVIIILSTIYDIYITWKEKEPAHLILIAFSWYNSGKKLFKVSNNPNQLPCLNGIRFISMMWVIVGHTYYSAFYSPSINSLEIASWMENPFSMYVLGATVSVDTFFVLGGLLVTYVYLSAKDKGIKLNIIMYYIHRYIRLTPSLAAAILLHVSLLRYVGSGPYWPEVMKYLETNCSKYWWSTLLYVQNYVNPQEVCIGQTWYLSVDMQLYILTPLALIPLGIWPQITLTVLGVLVFVSMVIPTIIAWIYEIPGLMTQSFTNVHYMTAYYSNTYTRFGPMVVGLILGYYIYHKNKNSKINALFKNTLFIAIGWIISILSLILIVFEPNNMYYHRYNRIESSLYIGIHRVAWSIALSWMIYACIIGRGGIINNLLSLPIFQILSRVTYSMYLIHLSFQTIKIGILRLPIHFGNFENMYNFWGDICFTAILGIFWTLTFESPMIIIEKILFKSGSSKKRETLRKV